MSLLVGGDIGFLEGIAVVMGVLLLVLKGKAGITLLAVLEVETEGKGDEEEEEEDGAGEGGDGDAGGLGDLVPGSSELSVARAVGRGASRVDVLFSVHLRGLDGSIKGGDVLTETVVLRLVSGDGDEGILGGGAGAAKDGAIVDDVEGLTDEGGLLDLDTIEFKDAGGDGEATDLVDFVALNKGSDALLLSILRVGLGGEGDGGKLIDGEGLVLGDDVDLKGGDTSVKGGIEHLGGHKLGGALGEGGRLDEDLGDTRLDGDTVDEDGVLVDIEKEGDVDDLGSEDGTILILNQTVHPFYGDGEMGNAWIGGGKLMDVHIGGGLIDDRRVGGGRSSQRKEGQSRESTHDVEGGGRRRLRDSKTGDGNRQVTSTDVGERGAFLWE